MRDQPINNSIHFVVGALTYPQCCISRQNYLLIMRNMSSKITSNIIIFIIMEPIASLPSSWCNQLRLCPQADATNCVSALKLMQPIASLPSSWYNQLRLCPQADATNCVSALKLIQPIAYLPSNWCKQASRLAVIDLHRKHAVADYNAILRILCT